MTRYMAVVAARIGPWVRVKIAPGFARSPEEAEATAEVLTGPRGEPAKDAATGIRVVR